MASFLKGILGGGALVLALWVVLWAGQLGKAHPNNQWINEAIAYKTQLAHALSSPKIVVVAGSGAMFGIDSGTLETAYGRPAVNLGVNAGISLPAILHNAIPAIGPGDLVLLPLEYPLYNREESVSSSLIHWANSHPETFIQLPLKRALDVFIHTSFTRILEGYRGVPAGFSISGDYGVHNLDSRGDQQHTARALREERHWNFLNSLPDETYGTALQEGRFDGGRLRRFRDELLAKGACPVFMPPPLLRQASYRDSLPEALFYERLPFWASEEGLYWVGSPRHAMREANDFFDTNFHLVNEARSAYTQQIIGWLGRQPMTSCQQFYQQSPR
ncbi:MULTISPECIES: hypothetical protein [Halomonas]|uniref:hypothetical protein n=1 Tax=Halomonas TaxID=2745 RepID=UPI000EEE3778|nr:MULTISPECIES: hypothetical protein [Halomonas]HCR97950.1 hypothetical protein [Halomonas sp.]